jgi:hypothetical protein
LESCLRKGEFLPYLQYTISSSETLHNCLQAWSVESSIIIWISQHWCTYALVGERLETISRESWNVHKFWTVCIIITLSAICLIFIYWQDLKSTTKKVNFFYYAGFLASQYCTITTCSFFTYPRCRQELFDKFSWATMLRKFYWSLTWY